MVAFCSLIENHLSQQWRNIIEHVDIGHFAIICQYDTLQPDSISTDDTFSIVGPGPKVEGIF